MDITSSYRPTGFLLLPQTPVADLEKARIATLNSSDIIESKLKEITEKIENLFTQLLSQTREALSLNEKQLADISRPIRFIL